MSHLEENVIIKSDEEKIRDFQYKLYQKAKQEPNYRFYILYDKIHMKRFLKEAYKRCKANDGSCGVDGVTFEKIESTGVEEFLEKLGKTLKEKSYRPQAVKRVMIPKANGKMRPLGIPTIADRVVQMSCKMVIEPIFEADFESSSYGFRPKKSAEQAIRAIQSELKSGKTEVYDADLSAYFDTIPHDKLMKLVGKRISDLDVLHLIKMWLKAPVKDDEDKGCGRKNKVGTPQGGVISPLLANIYLNLLDKVIVNKIKGYEIFRKLKISIVRYADDFVLLGKEIPKEAIEKLNEILGKMGLSLNEEKSQQVTVEEESFDFLGFTFRYERCKYVKGRKFLRVIPSKKSLKKLDDNYGEVLRKGRVLNGELLSQRINRTTIGWLNYFTIEGITTTWEAKSKMRYMLFDKLQRYFKKKSQRKCKLYHKGAFNELEKYYGLINPIAYRKTLVKA